MKYNKEFNTNNFCIDDILDIVKAKKKKLKREKRENDKKTSSNKK
jgi:hypothetical protein